VKAEATLNEQARGGIESVRGGTWTHTVGIPAKSRYPCALSYRICRLTANSHRSTFPVLATNPHV
jgi:hypothetical protein